MKRKVIMKRVGAMAMTAMLATSTMPVTTVFASDISGHWSEEVMTKWRNSGLISGFSDGTLRPDDILTRAQLAQLMNNSLGFSTQGFINFTDVNQSDWFYKAVNIAINSGYASGTSATLFSPNTPATRAQAALFVSNAIGVNTGSVSKYTDADEIPSWAVGAVGAMTNLGYMTGMPDGSFAPNAPLTRAQAVSMLDRVRQNFSAAPYIYTSGSYFMGDFFGSSSTTTTTDTTSSSGYITQGTNVIITEDGGILKDMVVEGDVTISSSVGNGDATLNNVIVRGDIIVEGGGSSSVSLIDTVADGTLILDKENVRVIFSGDTEISKVEFWEAAHLDSYSSYKGSVDEIYFPTRINKSNDCIIDVDVDTITVEKAISLVLESYVEELYIASGAAGTLIDVTKYAEVEELIVDGRVDIVGSGTIVYIEINVGGVTIDKDVTVEDMEVADGVEAPEFGDYDSDDDDDDDDDSSDSDSGSDSDDDDDDTGTGGTDDEYVPATVPALNAEPLITRTTATTATVAFSVNQPGEYTIRIVENELTDSQLASKSAFNDIDNAEGIHISNMSDSINAYTLQTAMASDLTANTAYYVYMMFEDENGNYRITDGYELTSSVAAAVVTTASELNAAVSIANGEVVKLGRDITAEATISMPIPAGVNIDLNGYTMGTLNITQSISTMSLSETAVPTGTVKIQNSSTNGKITKLNIASGVDTVYIETDVDTAVLTDVEWFETTHANADVNQVDVETNILSSEIPTIKNSAGTISKMSTKMDVNIDTNLDYLEILHNAAGKVTDEVVVTIEKGRVVTLVDTLKRTTILGEGAVSEIDIDISSGNDDIIVVVGPYLVNKQNTTDASDFVVYQYGDRDTETVVSIDALAYQSTSADGSGSAVSGWTPITVSLKVAVPDLGNHEATNGYAYDMNMTVPYGHIWLYVYEYTSINDNALPDLNSTSSTFQDLLNASNTYYAIGTNREQAEVVTIDAPYLKKSDGSKESDYITNESVTVEIRAIAATAGTYANRTTTGTGTITFKEADFSKWDALIEQYKEYAVDKNEYTYGSWDTFKTGVEKWVGDYYDPDKDTFATGKSNTVLVGQVAINAAVTALSNYLSGNEWLLVHKDEYNADEVSIGGVSISGTSYTKNDGESVTMTLNGLDDSFSGDITYTLKQGTNTIIENETYDSAVTLLETDASSGTYTLEITVPWSTNTSTTVLTYTIVVRDGENPEYAPEATVVFSGGTLEGKNVTGTAGTALKATVSFADGETGATASYVLTKDVDSSTVKEANFTLGTTEELLLDTDAVEGTYTLVITTKKDSYEDSTVTYKITLTDATLVDVTPARVGFTNATAGADKYTFNYDNSGNSVAVRFDFSEDDGDSVLYTLYANNTQVSEKVGIKVETSGTAVSDLISADATGKYQLVVTTQNDTKNNKSETYTINMPDLVKPVPDLTFAVNNNASFSKEDTTIYVPFTSIGEAVSLSVSNFADAEGGDLTNITVTVKEFDSTVGSSVTLNSATSSGEIISSDHAIAGKTYTIDISGYYWGVSGSGTGIIDSMSYTIVFADDNAASVVSTDVSTARTNATEGTVSFTLDTAMSGYTIVSGTKPADDTAYDTLTPVGSVDTTGVAADTPTTITVDGLTEDTVSDALYLVIEHTPQDDAEPANDVVTYAVIELGTISASATVDVDPAMASSYSVMSMAYTATPTVSGDATPIASSMATTGIVTGVDSAIVMSGGTTGRTVTVNTGDGSALADNSMPVVTVETDASGNVILTITAKKGTKTTLESINAAITRAIGSASLTDASLSGLSVDFTGTFGLPLYTKTGTIMNATTLK